jgi:glucosamine 6-phosphate synthetase-like amidotransferase/phosphosugar isomerase protein
MCGISAIYGEYAPLKAIIATVYQIERGREGTGTAFINDNKIKIIKEPIDPYNFFEKHIYDLNINVNMAIAHNRMPSIGNVCYENTHPFLDCKQNFALVHNGHIFINHLEEKLRREGHIIRGKTDSEILTHLLEDSYNAKRNMLNAIREIVQDYLSGTIAVITKDGQIYCAKNGFFSLYMATAFYRSFTEIYVASSKNALINLMIITKPKGYVINEIYNGTIVKIYKGKASYYKAQIKPSFRSLAYNFNYYSYFDFMPY